MGSSSSSAGERIPSTWNANGTNATVPLLKANPSQSSRCPSRRKAVRRRRREKLRHPVAGVEYEMGIGAAPGEAALQGLSDSGYGGTEYDRAGVWVAIAVRVQAPIRKSSQQSAELPWEIDTVTCGGEATTKPSSPPK